MNIRKPFSQFITHRTNKPLEADRSFPLVALRLNAAAPGTPAPSSQELYDAVGRMSSASHFATFLDRDYSDYEVMALSPITDSLAEPLLDAARGLPRNYSNAIFQVAHQVDSAAKVARILRAAEPNALKVASGVAETVSAQLGGLPVAFAHLAGEPEAGMFSCSVIEASSVGGRKWVNDRDNFLGTVFFDAEGDAAYFSCELDSRDDS